MRDLSFACAFDGLKVNKRGWTLLTNFMIFFEFILKFFSQGLKI